MSHGRVSLGTVTLLIPLMALGGCVSSSRFGDDPFGRPAMASTGGPEPIEPIPSGPIMTSDLPPLEGEDGLVEDGTRVAALPKPPTAPAGPVITTPTWRTMVGGWTAKEASGSCKVTLSSTPTLDFYKAATSGCSNKDLSRVSSWEFRSGEVYLYQPGGTVAARLKAGSGSMDGVLTNSGAPLNLSK